VTGSAITVGYAPQAAPIRANIQTYVNPVLDYTGKLSGPITIGTLVFNQVRKYWKPRPII